MYIYSRTIYILSVENFTKLKARYISETLRRIRDDLDSIQSQAKVVIKQIDPFDFNELVARGNLPSNLL